MAFWAEKKAWLTPVSEVKQIKQYIQEYTAEKGSTVAAPKAVPSRRPPLRSRKVGTGKWFELAADGQLVEILEHSGAVPSSPAAPPHPQIDPATLAAQPGAQGVQCQYEQVHAQMR